MNADPQTGVEIVITDPASGEVGVDVVGGTSLSCPMFTAFWAIANQAAGGGPIGQAAPILYELSEGQSGNNAIIDVNLNPLETLLDVNGFIFNPPSAPVTFESASALAQPLENTKLFISALFQSTASTRWDVFTFGTDSSLTTGPGWDNVTGLGTPNGSAFINAVLKALK
jgi:subtilase family serine protease